MLNQIFHSQHINQDVSTSGNPHFGTLEVGEEIGATPIGTNELRFVSSDGAGDQNRATLNLDSAGKLSCRIRTPSGEQYVLSIEKTAITTHQPVIMEQPLSITDTSTTALRVSGSGLVEGSLTVNGTSIQKGTSTWSRDILYNTVANSVFPGLFVTSYAAIGKMVGQTMIEARTALYRGREFKNGRWYLIAQVAPGTNDHLELEILSKHATTSPMHKKVLQVSVTQTDTDVQYNGEFMADPSTAEPRVMAYRSSVSGTRVQQMEHFVIHENTAFKTLTSGNTIWQDFTWESGRELAKISILLMYPSTSANTTLRIYNGAGPPAGSAIATLSKTINATLPDGIGAIEYELTSSLALTIGSQYTFEITHDGGGDFRLLYNLEQLLYEGGRSDISANYDYVFFTHSVAPLPYDNIYLQAYADNTSMTDCKILSSQCVPIWLEAGNSTTPIVDPADVLVYDSNDVTTYPPTIPHHQGKTKIYDTTESTAITNGSLVSEGGVGIKKSARIGNQLHADANSLEVGTSDTSGRRQVWYKGSNDPNPAGPGYSGLGSILRLGASSAAGDTTDIISEGIEMYGQDKFGNPLSSGAWSRAVIKPHYCYLMQQSSGGPAAQYVWRVDHGKMVWRPADGLSDIFYLDSIGLSIDGNFSTTGSIGGDSLSITNAISGGSLNITGGTTIGGTLVGATAIQLTPVTANPANSNALWIDSLNGDKMMKGTNSVMIGGTSSVANTLPRYASAGGNLLQSTNIVVDDFDSVTGVKNLTVAGPILKVGDSTSAESKQVHIQSRGHTQLWFEADTNNNSAADSDFIIYTKAGGNVGARYYINTANNLVMETTSTAGTDQDILFYTGGSYINNGIGVYPTSFTNGNLLLRLDASEQRIEAPKALITGNMTVEGPIFKVGDSTTSESKSIHFQSMGHTNMWFEADTNNTGSVDTNYFTFTKEGGATAARIYYSQLNELTFSTYSTGSDLHDVVFYTGGSFTNNGIGVQPSGFTDGTELLRLNATLERAEVPELYVSGQTLMENQLMINNDTTHAALIIGNGTATTTGMSVFANSNGESGTWTDNTTAATSASGSTFSLFSGVAAGNCAYIGRSTTFQGIHTVITSIIVLGTGSLIWEYWNGSVWTTVKVMNAIEGAPHTQYANTVFNTTASSNIRFGTTTGWTSKLLNGVTAYWVRVRIVAAITTSPTIEQILIHGNSTLVDNDGVMEYFGTSRPMMRDAVTFTRGTTGDLNITISPNVVLYGKDNRFANGVVDERSFSIILPQGIDTSSDINLYIQWKSNATSGNVELVIHYAFTSIGDVLGALPEKTYSKVFAVPSTAETVSELILDFDVQDQLPGSSMVVSIKRDATSGNTTDTAAGHFGILSMEFRWKRWAMI